MQGKKGHKTFIPGPASIGNPCHLYGPQIESSFSGPVRFGCCRPSEIFGSVSPARAREEGVEREDGGKAKRGSERLIDIGVGRGLRLGGRHFSLSLYLSLLPSFTSFPLYRREGKYYAGRRSIMNTSRARVGVGRECKQREPDYRGG